MTHEPVPTPNLETWPVSPSINPPATSAASRLPGAPPQVDEARGRQMEREQQMHEIAEQIGTALGRAVSGVLSLPDRVRYGLHLVKGQAREHAGSATDAASELAQSMSERISSLRQEATQTASQWKEKAGQRAGELNELAGEQIAEARLRVAHAARENPIRMIMGFAAAAFVLGVGLSLWRSTRG